MLPMQTFKDGDKITKVVVEDFYKVINRVYEIMDKSYNKASEALDSVHKDYDFNGEVWEGKLIIGTGISQPCSGDSFDEEIGNEIAFKKAKLNANLKKHRILERVWNSYIDALEKLDEELNTIDGYINRDFKDLRKYNPDYLKQLWPYEKE